MDDLAFSYDNPWVETSSKCLFVVHRWAQEFLASPTKYFYPEAVYCFRAGHRYSAASPEDIFFTSPLSLGDNSVCKKFRDTILPPLQT